MHPKRDGRTVTSMKSVPAKALVVLGLALAAAACASLPALEGSLTESAAVRPAETGLVREFAAKAQPAGGEGYSGVKLLARNDSALQWRLALIESAQTSIDVQTFIWDRDFSGDLLFERLLAAADRGVEVRVLIDDVFLTYPDRFIAALSSHENLEVRIFNPKPVRGSVPAKAVGFAVDFRQQNRRMHNKLFIVDGQVAIIGGRNIGDAYFGLSPDYNFRDLEVLTVGSELPGMRESFDAYWNSRYAFPGRELNRRGDEAYLERVRRRLPGHGSASSKKEAVAALSVRHETLFAYGVRQMVPVRARYVDDHPSDREDRSVTRALKEFLLQDREAVLLVTPYLVPDDEFFQVLETLSRRGMLVQALVPTMASNNHTIVHSQYRKNRAELLELGVELYEYKHQPGAGARTYVDWPSFRSSFVSLHMKLLLAPGEGAFVGSFNLDPRALRINTENALIIESEELAAKVQALLDPMLAHQQAWSVQRTNPGFSWSADDAEVRRQPARSWVQRLADVLFRLLPLQNQL